MTNLIERLNTGLGSASFDASLTGEVGQLIEIAQKAVALRDNPDGIAGFAASLAGLAAPNLPDGANVTGGLTTARAAIPSVTGGAAPDALADLARFGTLLAERLAPVLARTVEAAQAIEGLAKAEFHCPPAPPRPGVPTPPPAPAPATGQTRAQAAEQRAAEISNRIDQLPSPLTPGGLIDFLAGLASGQNRADVLPIPIPVFDDILFPLQTLSRWSVASPADLGADLESTLLLLRDRLGAAAAGRLDAVLSASSALQTPLRQTELASFATDYITAATAMAVALEAADTATAVARAGDLDTAITAFDALRTTQAADFTALVPGVAVSLRGVAADIHDHLLHLAVQLEPFDASVLVSGAASPEPADATTQQALRDLLAPITDFIEDLGEKLDLSAIEGAVATVATDAQAIADQITGALATVAQETRAAFAEVEQAVQALPLDDLATEIRAGITQAGDVLQSTIQDAFAPLRDAISSAIQAISDAVDGLDPEAVRAALAQVVSDITAILQDPAIKSAAEEIRKVLDQAATTAGSLSFAPITDEVIKLIDEMTQGLRALGDTDLNDALKGLLSVALAVLPPDLRPVTTPLIDDLGVRIDQGPVELLKGIREKPKAVVDRIRAFDPGKLAGEVLGAPFNEAMSALEAVKPSALIAPLSNALDTEKARLKEIASPSKALAPLVQAFDALLAEIDTLSPNALLAPIEDAVEKAIEDVVKASPVDEIFAEINQVFATIEAVLQTVDQIGQTLTKAAAALASLQDPDSAIDGWRDQALARIDAVPNAAALDALLTGIASGVDAARGADLLARYDAGIAGLKSDLDSLGAEAALASMVAQHQRLRPLVRALPTGADRTTIETALARFDPLDPAQAAGLRAASVLHQALGDGRANLEQVAQEYEPLLHGSDGALTALRNDATDATLLRTAVLADVEKALAPVRFLLGQLGGASVPVATIAAAFADMHTRLTAAVAGILTGPASLQTISNTVQSVVDALRNIDLAFLRESLDGVFDALRAEIEAAGPKPLIITLDREFGEVIDGLDLDLLLPAAEVAAMDQAAGDLVTKLRGFDPETLIGDAVRPAFEADVLPLVEALDITPVFDALIEALRGLEDQLEAEMGRINTAYQALLAARPGGLGGSASVATG